MSAKCTQWTLLALFVVACGTSGGEETPAAADAGRTDGGERIVVPEGCDVAADPHSAPACSVDSYVVYVSASAKDNNEGTRAKPVKTIAKAMTLVGKNRPRVYVCAGEYAEAVKLDYRGVVLVGGFDCDSWGKGAETHVAPSEPGPAFHLSNGDVPSAVWDVRFTAKDGALPGDSSIAAMVDKSAPVTFTRVTFEAGKGVDGSGGAIGEAGTAGEKGNDANMTTPGAAKLKSCVWGSSQGGAGGSPKVAGGDGLAEPSATPMGPRDGKGGAGYSVGTGKCETANGGADGAARKSGVGATSSGTILDTWSRSFGSDGETGNPGQGGGGGGGGNTVASGGGGSGGCGGGGGLGGASGGSSIGLLIRESSVTLSASKLATSAAGSGGAGGAGGAGGGGGGGGTTGACGGGQAGNGAGGGGGGGGAGGMSVGIASRTSNVTLDAETSAGINVGTAGGGGAGGSGGAAGSNELGPGISGLSGTAGVAGISQPIYELN